MSLYCHLVTLLSLIEKIILFMKCFSGEGGEKCFCADIAGSREIVTFEKLFLHPHQQSVVNPVLCSLSPKGAVFWAWIYSPRGRWGLPCHQHQRALGRQGRRGESRGRAVCEQDSLSGLWSSPLLSRSLCIFATCKPDLCITPKPCREHNLKNHPHGPFGVFFVARPFIPSSVLHGATWHRIFATETPRSISARLLS